MANMKTKKDDDRDIRKTESMIGGSKSSRRELGMQSVVHGIDKNPDITAADPKAKFIAKDKDKKSDRMKAAKGGRAKNTRRMNRLEELGRVDAEKAYTKKGKRNLKAEKKRIVRSLNSRGAAVRGHGKEIK
jgi:hypothetical protein